MSSPLTVIITSHSENVELAATITSIRETSPADIFVVDDCSLRPVLLSVTGVPIVRTNHRIGVGPARTLGALNAKTPFLLFVDSHMRFPPGWYEAAMARIAMRPTTLHCGVCLGLDRNHMDLNAPNATYCGGTLNICGPDRNNRLKRQVLEAIWNHGEIADDAEIPCVMGASYFIARDYFLKLSPLERLRSWGDDELMLSVKVWRSGGDVRLLKNVRIGHKFRLKNERIPFTISSADRLHNKLLAILTLTEEPLTSVLLKSMRREFGFSMGWRSVLDDWPAVELERARNSHLFTRSFEWFAHKFGLSIPS